MPYIIIENPLYDVLFFLIDKKKKHFVLLLILIKKTIMMYFFLSTQRLKVEILGDCLLK